MSQQRFEGTDTYVTTQDLMLAVNAAITLGRPLLVKGEPGTGKTMLAEEVARALGAPLISWHVKSTTRAQQGLYEYDAVSRLRDSQLGDGGVGDHNAMRVIPGQFQCQLAQAHAVSHQFSLAPGQFNLGVGGKAGCQPGAVTAEALVGSQDFSVSRTRLGWAELADLNNALGDDDVAGALVEEYIEGGTQHGYPGVSGLDHEGAVLVTANLEEHLATQQLE